MVKISLGELFRQDGGLNEQGVVATHAHDRVFANSEQIADARILANRDREKAGFAHWLNQILCRDNRIPFTPFDEEQIDC